MCHIIHPSKCTIQWFLIYLQSCAILEHVPSSQKETLVPFVVTSQFPPIPFSPSARQPLSSFLSLYVCLCWTCHMNGIIQYVVFCDWFISLMLSRLVRVVACQHSSFARSELIVWVTMFHVSLHQFTGISTF